MSDKATTKTPGTNPQPKAIGESKVRSYTQGSKNNQRSAGPSGKPKQ